MNPDQKSIAAIVIPVFNRRETTLRCIRHLDGLGAVSWARVIVVDDASPDGTADALRAEFPEVQIVEGDGNLWWSGGINMGTEAALAQNADHVFWLNDDCFPRPGTLEKLLEASKSQSAITTATVQLIETGYFSSGGHRKTPFWVSLVVPEGENLEPCEAFSGNCVCIPKSVFSKIGLIDRANFPHISDFDFSLRATNAGVKILAVGGAFCDGNDPPLKNRRSWLFGDISIMEIWSITFHPIYGWLAPWAWHLRWRHWGLRGLLMCMNTLFSLLRATVVRLIIPQPLLKKWFGRFSHTHRVHSQYDEWLKNNQPAAAPPGA